MSAAAALLALTLSAPSPSPSPLPARVSVVTVRYTPADREKGRYQYVPFTVPEDTAFLTVAYQYDRRGGANVIDLGLFEPGPLDLGTAAFRGYSGAERASITLSMGQATPGYWPGPLPKGEWHVLLGLTKVAEAGVDVKVTVRAQVGEPDPWKPLPERPPEPIRKGTRWYSGALHTHTVHSDGQLTVADVSRLARDSGLDFLAITDHNNTAHQLEDIPADGLLRIVGEEVTTPGGHASVWGGLIGPREYVDFRVLPTDPRIADLVGAATARGAVFSLNHPRAACVSCAWEHAVPEGVTGIEVTGGTPDETAAAIALWDSLLQQGRRVVAVGSSDWHRLPAPIEQPSVRVRADELSTRAILEGIRRGRVVIMADGRTPPPELLVRVGGREAETGDTLSVFPGQPVRVEVQLPEGWLIGRVDLVADGVVVGSRPAAERVAFDAPAAARYVRVQVLAADGTLRALTNPVFLEPAPESTRDPVP